MKKYFDIKFTFTNSIVIGMILSIGGAVFGAYSSNYEIMYAGVGLLTARTGFNAFGKNEK